MDAQAITAVVGAIGVGGAIQAGIGYLGNRKKTASDANKVDAETQLAYLTTVIEQLDEQSKRVLEREQRTQEELAAEQERTAKLRARVRELEDEIDSVRASARETQKTARETQRKCDELGAKLRLLSGTDETGKEMT